MRRGIGIASRAISVAGLLGLSVLHGIWASGSSWPAKDSKQLAEAVVGQAVEVPAAAPTAVVAFGAAGAGVLASGALGNVRIQLLGLRAMGFGMLLRATFGGGVALALLRLPPAGETFRNLDRRYYRPFAAVLGASLLLSAADASVSTCPQPGQR